MANEENIAKSNVLVFASERVGLKAPAKRIEGRNYNVNFEPLDTNRRFDEFDGVVVFQRTFEDLTYSTTQWASGWKHKVLTDDLDRRTKEANLLLEHGGFICFVLHQPLVDRDGSRSFESTDLVKRYLRGPNFYREDLESRVVNTEASTNEFERFLKLFGGAHTIFKYLRDAITQMEIKPLARVRGHVVGMIFGSQILFVPSILPSWSSDVAQEYFELLIDATLTTVKRVQVEVPEWAREFQFEEETGLADRRKELSESMASIDARMDVLGRMKRVLVADSAALVADVGFVLERGLGFQIEAIEDFKEDTQVLSDDRSKVIMLCEIKGVNRGVKREHINQADNHRERANLPEEFPTLLIVNAGIKSARTLAEKDLPIDQEQIRHAVRSHVLILRTIDLLYLARLQAAGRVSKDEVRDLLLTKTGWLKADSGGFTVEHG
jgi:hypothetical protein